ncbi:hypothetical protein [Lutibacter sp.]|uniref:hypothetical protein n=1 Tax=Lutibacter sp. TaxID=1925666 RepID=UPI0025BC7FF1|nr:hypothetical protein [Lutibacter sp.]MCF6181384.1 hypothetical protein [Lutibacter sp.]
MRKLLLLFLLTSFFSCEKNNSNDILPNIDVNVVLDLNLPQYVQLKTPSDWVYVQGGLQGIVVQNTGIGNPHYKAFERACPNNDCTVPMTFDGSLKLKCSCDNSEYSIIDGSPQTTGNIHFAREYKVNEINENTLIITNY